MSLRILDLDFDRNEIIVHHGKGDKDRHVMIPRALICELKSHIENLRKIHEEDLKAGFGSVKLPQALSDKYQGGSKEFKWQWLFPQKNRWKNIQTGEEGRWHLDESLMQRAVKQPFWKLASIKTQLATPFVILLQLTCWKTDTI